MAKPINKNKPELFQSNQVGNSYPAQYEVNSKLEQ